MATPRTRKSRVFTVSFPEPMAEMVTKIAEEENRSISEVFREAFRAYQWRILERKLEAVRATLPPTNYTEDDVEELVHQVRREAQESQVA
jgi:metal-responsive CopG/Arc/MetJ family transcriptional regulator